VVWNESNDGSVDLSHFFARYSFPKLQQLKLEGCSISSWDLIMSRTTALTTLSLCPCDLSPIPTTSQLLSILASNPTLQTIKLFLHVIPEDNDGNTSLRVQLPNLRELGLIGEARRIFGLLHRLDHPKNMDSLSICLIDWAVRDVSQIVGPYLRDYLRRRGTSRELELYLSSTDLIELHVGDGCKIDSPTPGPPQTKKFLEIRLEPIPSKNLQEKVIVELIAHLPREDIVHSRVDGEPVCMEDFSANFPHLKAIHFEGARPDVTFWNPTRNKDVGIFPSLRHVVLDREVVDSCELGALMTFLAHRASSGNQLDSLEIKGSFNMDPIVKETIRESVRDFKY
jgi:hypothetical protein